MEKKTFKEKTNTFLKEGNGRWWLLITLILVALLVHAYRKYKPYYDFMHYGYGWNHSIWQDDDDFNYGGMRHPFNRHRDIFDDLEDEFFGGHRRHGCPRARARDMFYDMERRMDYDMARNRDYIKDYRRKMLEEESKPATPTQNNILLRLTVPNTVKLEDVKLTIKDNLLTVNIAKENHNDGNHSKSASYFSFSQTVSLTPEQAKMGVGKKLENNILTVYLKGR